MSRFGSQLRAAAKRVWTAARRAAAQCWRSARRWPWIAGIFFAWAALVLFGGDSGSSLLTRVKEGAQPAGVILAMFGLWRWREEMRGKARFDACRQLLEKTLHVQGAFVVFRNPIATPGELSAALVARGKDGSLGEFAKVLEAIRFMRIDRLEKVRLAMVECETAVVVAEVLLGPPVKESFQALQRCWTKASRGVRNLHQNEQGIAHDPEKELERLRSIVAGDEDEFASELASAVESIRLLTERHIHSRFFT